MLCKNWYLLLREKKFLHVTSTPIRDFACRKSDGKLFHNFSSSLQQIRELHFVWEERLP